MNTIKRCKNNKIVLSYTCRALTDDEAELMNFAIDSFSSIIGDNETISWLDFTDIIERKFGDSEEKNRQCVELLRELSKSS